MRKLILMLMIFLSIFSLASCDSKNIKSDKEITCENIIDVYEKEDYEIFHEETTDQGYNWKCSVKCTAPNSDDYIFFYIFETNEEAKSYAKEREWNLLLFFMSFIMGEPTWLSTKTYNNIVIEYDNNYLYKPFNELL